MRMRLSLRRSSPCCDDAGFHYVANFRTTIRLLLLAIVTGVVVALLMPSAASAAGWPPNITPPASWNPGPPFAPLQPHSHEMNQIRILFWVVFALGAVVLAFVGGFMFVNVTRFSAKFPGEEPNQVFGNKRVEIAWTIIPVAVLVVAFGFTTYYIHDINTPPARAHLLDIDAIGHQWWWEFQYPGLGVVTANEVHIPVGANVHFHVQSDDVIHSFWTPSLQRQIDANPGQDNAVYVTLNQPGVYGGMCYEYCGAGHAWMKYEVIVQPKAEFDAWIKHQRQPAIKSANLSPLARQGRTLFLHQTCVSCHAINGEAAGGAVAPNLTHVGSRWAIGAGAAQNSIQGLESWIYNPNDYKPGVYMPMYRYLPEKQIKAISAYIYSLK